jgi:hypothetical protein
MAYICLICNGSGFINGRSCPLCRTHPGKRATSFSDLSIHASDKVVHVGRDCFDKYYRPVDNWDNYIFGESSCVPGDTITEIQRYRLIEKTLPVQLNALFSIHEEPNGKSHVLKYDRETVTYVSQFEDVKSAKKYCDEQGWPHEISRVNSEVGELYHIYTDFATLLSRMGWILEHVPEERRRHVRKSMNQIRSAMQTVMSTEMDLRVITQVKAPPERKAIAQAPISLDVGREFRHISSGISKISVRVRNVGQALNNIRSVDVRSAIANLEKISAKLHRAWTDFYKVFED